MIFVYGSMLYYMESEMKKEIKFPFDVRDIPKELDPWVRLKASQKEWDAYEGLLFASGMNIERISPSICKFKVSKELSFIIERIVSIPNKKYYLQYTNAIITVDGVEYKLLRSTLQIGRSAHSHDIQRYVCKLLKRFMGEEHGMIMGVYVDSMHYGPTFGAYIHWESGYAISFDKNPADFIIVDAYNTATEEQMDKMFKKVA